MTEYEILRILWWVLLGVLLMGLAVMDGFDMGTAALLPVVARTDVERRIAINTVGPVWEGNQVWLILGGGAIFAAWPPLYAAAFSGFYLAMLLVLAALILRPVGFKFRSKIANPRWREIWDWALVVGGAVPALVFGVAFGNLFEGVKFDFDPVDLRFLPDISLLSLLNPFALLAGLVSLSMLTLHGACWLNLKASGEVARRARDIVPWLALIFAVLFLLGGIWSSQLTGYRLAAPLPHAGPSNPLLGAAERAAGAWGTHFVANPEFWLAPIVALAVAGLAVLWRASRPLAAFLASALVPVGVIATAGLVLYPFLLPSSSNPKVSLIVWNASSSALTLAIMLGAVVIFLPIVLAYTAWVYRVLRGPVSSASIDADSNSY